MCDCVCVGVGVRVGVCVCAHTLITNDLTFMTQGAAGKVIVLQPTKTAMTFRGIDLGRQANIPSETVEQVFILRMFRYMLKGFHSFDFADFRVLDFEGD